MKCPKQLDLRVPFVILERVLARWWRLVAFMKSTNLLHQAVCAVSYRCIATAIDMASKVGTCCIVNSFAVALAAARAMRSEYLPNGGIQWLPVKPWLCFIGRCAPYGTDALPWQSKWPATEVEIAVIVAKDHVIVHLN